MQQMWGNGKQEGWSVSLWKLWGRVGRKGEYGKECAEEGDDWDGFEIIDQMNSSLDKFP